jgi:hypothetical protein
MIARLTFLAIAAFWITMNVLLWRAEFGAHGGETPVPVALVWQKILTAPEDSSLSVFQNCDRMGFCQISTSVSQQMADLEENKLPSEGFAARAGNQLHLTGNIAFGDFTNRFKFDGRIRFSAARQWQEFNLKITSRGVAVELHSLATNRTVRVKINNAGAALLDRELTFDELENPGALLPTFAGGFADGLLGAVDLPALTTGSAAQKISWDAQLARIKIGTESVPVFRVETRVLDRPIVIDASTLGEILRVELPGGITVRIDEWARP